MLSSHGPKLFWGLQVREFSWVLPSLKTFGSGWFSALPVATSASEHAFCIKNRWRDPGEGAVKLILKAGTMLAVQYSAFSAVFLLSQHRKVLGWTSELRIQTWQLRLFLEQRRARIIKISFFYILRSMCLHAGPACSLASAIAKR